MYPKWAGVPRISPVAHRTSSAAASRAGTSRTSTSPASGSRQPASTRSTISWVWPEFECHTTRSRASGIGRHLLAQRPLEDLARGVHGQLVDQHQAPGLLEPTQPAPGEPD